MSRMSIAVYLSIWDEVVERIGQEATELLYAEKYASMPKGMDKRLDLTADLRRDSLLKLVTKIGNTLTGMSADDGFCDLYDEALVLFQEAFDVNIEQERQKAVEAAVLEYFDLVNAT